MGLLFLKFFMVKYKHVFAKHIDVNGTKVCLPKLNTELNQIIELLQIELVAQNQNDWYLHSIIPIFPALSNYRFHVYQFRDWNPVPTHPPDVYFEFKLHHFKVLILDFIFRHFTIKMM